VESSAEEEQQFAVVVDDADKVVRRAFDGRDVEGIIAHAVVNAGDHELVGIGQRPDEIAVDVGSRPKRRAG
jgi:hypothetical protein